MTVLLARLLVLSYTELSSQSKVRRNASRLLLLIFSSLKVYNYVKIKLSVPASKISW